MSKIILLVGHCGPDSSYLRSAVRSADRDAQILAADDQAELAGALAKGVDLALLNRDLGYGFEPEMGVEQIRQWAPKYPDTTFMLITNYPEVQKEAQAAGAAPGFGKREIRAKRGGHLSRGALGRMASLS